MQIAIITSVHEPLDIRIFYKEATTLAKAGYQVTLIAPFDINAIETINNHNITFIPLYSSKKRYERPKLWFQIMHHLRSLNADVWHFHDPELLPLAIIWKRLFVQKVNLIYDVHEDVPKSILDKNWIFSPLRKFISLIVNYIEGWGIRQCQLVIAATDSINKRVSSHTDKFVIVRNYPLTSQQYQAQRKKNECQTVKVIYAGLLTEARGIRQIIKAMNVLENHLNIELILLGEIYPVYLEKEARKIAGSNVIFKGKVPFTDVREFMQNSDIGIVCFLPVPNHIEAMPNKLFEYMQSGLPVIASDFPLWKQIVKESQCGILVDPTDPTEIANAILRLSDDPDLRERMGRAGTTAVYGKYSWSRESTTLLEAYNEIENTLK